MLTGNGEKIRRCKPSNGVLQMSPNIRQFFDYLSDGLLILNAQGFVRYANPAAIALSGWRLDEKLPSPRLSQALADLIDGTVTSPQQVIVDIGQSEVSRPVEATLISSPVADEFLLLMPVTDKRQDARNTFANFIEMLDSSLERPTQKLIGAAERMLESFAQRAGDDFVLAQEVGELRRAADELRNEIQLISLFATSCSAVTMLSDERIVIPELLAEAVASARPKLLPQGIRLCFAGINDSLPVIYGSRYFLGKALTVYLKHLAAELEPNSYIQISAERSGSFLRLVMTDYGNKGPEFPTEITESSFAEQDFESGRPLDLSLPICKRILELHRGHLQILTEDERLHRIVFELPAGTPPVADIDLGMRQALRYAHDLLLLLKQRELHGEVAQSALQACAS